jgi:hypothetical protein
MKGPFIIIFRGHSGSRLLTDAFLQNGFWMGSCGNRTRDAREFDYRIPAVRDLVKGGIHYAEAPAAEQQRLQQQMRDLGEASKSLCPHPDSLIAYGWKRAINTFLVEVFLDAYPQGKVIHLIRDGRDVMLSRLARVEEIDDPVVRYMVFGNEELSEYRGRPLAADVVKKFRNELEMHHWVTSVRFGMRGRKHANRYMEVFYEELCEKPVDIVGRVFEFLQVPFFPQTREYLVKSASTNRICKWKTYENLIKDEIEIGKPLLEELGYMK